MSRSTVMTVTLRCGACRRTWLESFTAARARGRSPRQVSASTVRSGCPACGASGSHLVSVEKIAIQLGLGL